MKERIRGFHALFIPQITMAAIEMVRDKAKPVKNLGSLAL